MTWRLGLLLLILPALFQDAMVYAAHNITIASTDPSIVYNGTWGQNPSSLAYGGVHAFSEDRNATATFNFTGIAIYYMAPLWPYTVNTLVTVDSDTPTLIDMTDSHNGTIGDSEDEPAQVLWGQAGLSNTPHTFVASMWPDGMYVVINALIYTVLDPSDTNPPPPSPALPSSSLGSAARSSHGVPQPLDDILLGVICSLFFVVAGIAAFLFYRRWRRQKQSQPWSVASSSSDSLNEAPSSATSSSKSLSLDLPVQIVDLRKQQVRTVRFDQAYQ